jgi:hypothetical protein
VLRTAQRLLPAVALALLAAGCGSAGDQHRFGTVTDCTKVGPITQVDDPAGDQRGKGPDASPQPQGDLAGLRIARGRGQLCVEFRTRGAIKPFAAFLLVLHPRTAAAPVVQLQASVLSAQPPSAMLDTGDRAGFRHVSAKVGIDGSRLTVLIGRGEFSRVGVQAVFDAFRFQGRSAVVTGKDARVTDCVPSCA